MPGNSTRITISCVQCSRTFEVIPSKRARKFCGHRCYTVHAQSQTIEDAFRSRVGNYDASGCLIWAGHVNDSGYGTFTMHGNHDHIRAHRVAWELVHGPIPDGLCVLHHCDNRVCVNAEHLFLGTRADNIADMVCKGRQHKGETVRNSRLTEEDIRQIRWLYATGLFRQVDIAEMFDVQHTAICKIVRRDRWKHLP